MTASWEADERDLLSLRLRRQPRPSTVKYRQTQRRQIDEDDEERQCVSIATGILLAALCAASLVALFILYTVGKSTFLLVFVL